jgi:hypothetical protein
MAEPAAAALPPGQAQAYDQAGAPIAPDDLPKAVAEGRAGFDPTARIYARNARGALVTIAPEDAAHPGYTILTPAQVEQAHAQKQYGEGVGNVAKATGLAALRGATLGGSDAVIAGLGGEGARKALKGYREANPVASTVGEVGGAVAPLLLSGGGSAAVEGAGAAGAGAKALSAAGSAVRAAGVVPRATAALGGIVERGVARGLEAAGYEGKSLLARAGAGALKMGAQGAAEGAIYGGAAAANDAVLNGDDITAEKIVSGMGHGALFGGGVGGVLGAAGPLVTGAANALIPKKEALRKLAAEQSLRSITTSSAEMRKLAGRATGETAERRVLATGEDLANAVFETGELKGQRVLAAGANAEEIAPRINAFKEEIGAKLAGVKKELSDQMAAAGKSPDVGELLGRIKASVTDPLMASKVPGQRGMARAVDRQLSILAEEQATRVAAAAGDLEAAAKAVPPPTFEQLDAIRQDLRKVFQPPAPSGGGLPPQPPKAAEALQKAERTIADFLKEKASVALHEAGEDANAYNELNRQYNSFSQLDRIASKQVSGELGRRFVSPSDHALGVTSALGALATGNVGALGAMGYGAAASMANNLLRHRGNSVIADMARRASELDGSIDHVAAALAGGAEKAKQPALATMFQGENLRESYERASTRVRELATPQIAASHIEKLIPEVAAQYPHVGSAVSTKLLQIYQQLSGKLPQSQPDIGATLTPLAVKQRVSPTKMRSFMSSVAGALEPQRVISDLGRGIIDREAIDAMKTAHPKIFQQLRTRVADEVSKRETELPFKRRVLLSMVFDFVGDSSLDPARMAGLQETARKLTDLDKAIDAQAVKPKQGNPGVSRLGKSMALPGQSAISGGS